MALPFVAHSAAEYYRWVVRSQLRLDGRRFARRLRADARVPVLTSRATATARCAPSAPRLGGYVTGRYEEHVIAGAGHFLPEEAPEAVNAHLDPLARPPRLTATRRRGGSQPAAQPPVPTGAVAARAASRTGRGLAQGQRVAGARVVERLGEDDADDPAVRDSSGPPELPGSTRA